MPNHTSSFTRPLPDDEKDQTPSSPFAATFLVWIDLFMHRSMRSFLRYARERGLSMSQVAALFQIHQSGRLAVSDIGDNLGVTNAAASQLLDRLVLQGLVLRSENPQDRREKQLALTDLGRQVLQESSQTRLVWLERLTCTLSLEEQVKVAQGLEILIDHMRQDPDMV
jgi:DNA-binding MarR family transcriptional regulator